MLIFDFALLGVGAYGIYVSTIGWWIGFPTSTPARQRRTSCWLSGWLMVLPNAMLAMYYARRGNPEVVYTSQVGDGHISIPLSVGDLYLYRTIQVPAFSTPGLRFNDRGGDTFRRRRALRQPAAPYGDGSCWPPT